jgi:hypothetical protein
MKDAPAANLSILAQPVILTVLQINENPAAQSIHFSPANAWHRLYMKLHLVHFVVQSAIMQK